MSTVLESLAALVKRQKTKAADYPELVRAYADGKPIDVEQTESVLHAAQKTAEDLQADVKAIIRRRQLAEAAAKGPAIAKRQDELREQLQREQAAWEAKTRTHYETVLQPIEDELERVTRQSAECSTAQRELFSSAPQYLKDQERELSHELQAGSATLNHLRRYADACRARVHYHENPLTRKAVTQWDRIEPPMDLPMMGDLKTGGDIADVIRHYQRAAERAEAKIAELEPNKRELETQLQAIQAKRLEP